MNWIPYESGVNVSFTDGTDTLRLSVKEVYRSAPYKSESWIIERSCYSDAQAFISGDTAYPEINVLSMNISDPSEMADYSYSLTGSTVKDADGNILISGWSTFSFQLIDNKITIEHYKPVDLMASYNNGYKEYANVLRLDADTSLNYYKPWVYRVYIAENVGLIQFTELRSEKTWSLDEY
jgi:hypothetical protein